MSKLRYICDNPILFQPGECESYKRCDKCPHYIPVITAEFIMRKLLRIHPQINPKSIYTNPFLYSDVENWYNELKEDSKKPIHSRRKLPGMIAKQIAEDPPPAKK